MGTIEERANVEADRLKRLLFDYNIPEKRVNLMRDTIQNVAWMKVKLDDTRETIRQLDVAIPFDNGGGQTGIRQNPLFKGYESLWKSYMAGLKSILELLPDEGAVEEEVDRPKTVLELVRERHNA